MDEYMLTLSGEQKWKDARWSMISADLFKCTRISSDCQLLWVGVFRWPNSVHVVAGRCSESTLETIPIFMFFLFSLSKIYFTLQFNFRKFCKLFGVAPSMILNDWMTKAIGKVWFESIRFFLFPFYKWRAWLSSLSCPCPAFTLYFRAPRQSFVLQLNDKSKHNDNLVVRIEHKLISTAIWRKRRRCKDDSASSHSAFLEASRACKL